MALLIPDVGEIFFGKRCLYVDASAENLTLKLGKTNVVPAESDTAGSYTEADFTGYSAKTITSSQSGSTWAVPTTSTGTTSSTYGTNQTFNFGSTQTVYLLYYVGATSGTLAAAEGFASGKTGDNGDALTIVPKFQFA